VSDTGQSFQEAGAFAEKVMTFGCVGGHRVEKQQEIQPDSAEWERLESGELIVCLIAQRLRVCTGNPDAKCYLLKTQGR
jgi:hypothetical protein